MSGIDWQEHGKVSGLRAILAVQDYYTGVAHTLEEERDQARTALREALPFMDIDVRARLLRRFPWLAEEPAAPPPNDATSGAEVIE